MGCCVSTHKKGPAGNPMRLDHHPISPPSNHHAVSKSPPRAEEEAVKEVLSETPLVVIPAKPNNPDPDPDPSPSPNPYYYTPIPKINHGSAAANGFPTAILAASNHRSASPRKQQPPSLHLHHQVHHPTAEIARLPPPEAVPHPKILSPPSPAAVTPDEISEVSEISCLSESVSTATACDGEVRQRVPRSSSPGRIHKASSFSADPAVRRERMTGKSPVRRSDPSPRRTGPGRESGQIVVRNRVGGTGIGDGQGKREPGENSRRRSRSPATRNETVVSRSNVGRSPSGQKTGPSPGRVRIVHPGSGSGGGGGGGDGCERKGEENEWDPNPTVPSESLENPLVSLECFIFL